MLGYIPKKLSRAVSRRRVVMVDPDAARPQSGVSGMVVTLPTPRSPTDSLDWDRDVWPVLEEDGTVVIRDAVPSVSRGRRRKEYWLDVVRAARSSPDVQECIESRDYDSSSGRGYVSYVIPRSEGCLRRIRLGLDEMPCARTPLTHGQHSWLFVGRNFGGDEALYGRPEHVDSTSAVATWHLQLVGTKVWRIAAKGKKAESVACEPGDLLLLDTTRCRHSTYIPSKCDLSMSLARDLRNIDAEEPEMINVDSMTAARELSPGTVVLTESDCPGCELERSLHPNCEVQEDPTTCGMVLVAIVHILPGDTLTVLPSDDEDDGDSDSS